MLLLEEVNSIFSLKKRGDEVIDLSKIKAEILYGSVGFLPEVFREIAKKIHLCRFKGRICMLALMEQKEVKGRLKSKS